MKTAPGRFKIVEGVAVVGENVTAVFSPDVDLHNVIVPIKVGRRDLNPLAVHLAERSFVAKPGTVVVQKLFDIGNAHENNPFCILDAPVMLQCSKKASQVENRSSVLV